MISDTVDRTVRFLVIDPVFGLVETYEGHGRLGRPDAVGLYPDEDAVFQAHADARPGRSVVRLCNCVECGLPDTAAIEVDALGVPRAVQRTLDQTHENTLRKAAQAAGLRDGLEDEWLRARRAEFEREVSLHLYESETMGRAFVPVEDPRTGHSVVVRLEAGEWDESIKGADLILDHEGDLPRVRLRQESDGPAR